MPDALSRYRRFRKDAIPASVFPMILAVTFLPLTARQSHACTDGETQPCALQSGVCAESLQTCVDGEWQACDYGPDFEELESSCDRLDNDCDGLVDDVDLDYDGNGVCSSPKRVNELLLTGFHGERSTISLFEYQNGTYEETWWNNTSDVFGTASGGKAGDLTGDGVPEIVLERLLGELGNPPYRLEVWSSDGADGLHKLWQSAPSYDIAFYPGDIADVDNDGVNEILVTKWDRTDWPSNTTGSLESYSWDGEGLSLEATVRDCGSLKAVFKAAAGDLNGNGTPEILFQCYTPEDLVIQEYANGSFPIVGNVTPPPPLLDAAGQEDGVMVIDDIETGDVNGDGRADAVFCGNSGQGHVITYQNGTYILEFNSLAPTEKGVFSQSCSIGDITNDGVSDFLVLNEEGPKVYSHDGSGYFEVWAGPPLNSFPLIDVSFIGDSDNDGYNEFFFLDIEPLRTLLYESDVVGATSFTNTHTFEFHSSAILIDNINRTNDKSEIDCDDTDPARGAGWFCGTDYSRPAAGSGGGVGGTRWSDEFTVCNTSDEDRELLFAFTERGDPGQPVRKRAETISASACVTYADPVGQWFGEEMYGALLIDVMNGPAEDIRISGLFKGETEDGVMGQFFGSAALEDAVTGDAYILTTADPEQNRLGTGFQATRDGTDLEITLENPIGQNHWRKVLNSNWKAGDNDLYSRIERKVPGVSNLVIHYKVNEGAVVPFGTITDNESGDPAARGPATPASYLVLPVIGKTSGAAGVDWFSEFLIANMTQEPNTVQLNLYLDELLTGEITLWRDEGDNPVALEEGVGALEILAEDTVIAGSKFNSVDRETDVVMGLSLKAMAEPNLVPEHEYLFLGVRNEDETGVVRARLNFTNLTDQNATLQVDVLRQDGTLVGSFEKTARAKGFNDWRIPKSLTEVGETYTLVVTTTQPGYAFLSQMNESNDAICNYPLAVNE